MATLKIDYLKNVKGKGLSVIKSICVVGRKMSYADKKRNYGKGYANTHEIYYVAKPNEMGIRWVMVDLKNECCSDVCSNGDKGLKLGYDGLRVNIC